MARISSAVLTQTNGAAPSVQLRMKPRSRRRRPDRLEAATGDGLAAQDPNQVSISFIHEAEVEVKWKWTRLCRRSHRPTAGGLWVEL